MDIIENMTVKSPGRGGGQGSGVSAEGGGQACTVVPVRHPPPPPLYNSGRQGPGHRDLLREGQRPPQVLRGRAAVGCEQEGSGSGLVDRTGWPEPQAMQRGRLEMEPWG